MRTVAATLLLLLALPALPSPPEPTMPTPRARYEAWLELRAPGSRAIAGPNLGASPYELFSAAGTPGSKLWPAAVSATEIVVPNEPAGWRAFLTSAAPDVLQDQIGWLQGAWVSHSPTAPVSRSILEQDLKARAYIVPAACRSDPDGTQIFEAFYGEPPSMDPFRFRVLAKPGGAVTFETDPVWRLP